MIGFNHTEIKKLPCHIVDDPLTGKTFNYCFNGVYYPDSVDNVTPYSDLNDWLTETRYTKSKRYSETKNGKTTYYDINVPVDENTNSSSNNGYPSYISGVMSRIPGVIFATDNHRTLKISYRNTTGLAQSNSFSTNMKTTIGGILSPISFEIGGSYVYVSEHYNESSFSAEVTYEFYNYVVDGKLNEFTVVQKALYYPIRIDTYALCSDSNECKGQRGSYVSERDYVMIPITEISLIRCFKGNSYYYFDCDDGHVGPITNYSMPHYFYNGELKKF